MSLPIAPIRQAARQLRASYGFTAAAVLTLALGIGGTTAIVTLIDAVMFRPLPVSDPGRLYRIGDADTGRAEGGPQGRWGFFPFSLYERLKAGAPEFEDVTAFDWGRQMSVRKQGQKMLPSRCARNTLPELISPPWALERFAAACLRRPTISPPRRLSPY